MSLNPLVLEITEGIAEFSNRVGLKTLMSQYGEVDVCWIPPYMEREKEVAYVKFKTADSAELAMSAMTQGLVQMHGVLLQGRYRMGLPPKTNPDADKGGAGESPESSSRGGGAGASSKQSSAASVPTYEMDVVVDQFFGEKQSLGLKLSNSKEVVQLEHPAAENFGWQVGDRILAANGKPAADIAELVNLMKDIKASPQPLPVTFLVVRKTVAGGAQQGSGGRTSTSPGRGSEIDGVGGAANIGGAVPKSASAGGSGGYSQHGALAGINAVRDLISQNSLS
eukprot:g9832.t1